MFIFDENYDESEIRKQYPSKKSDTFLFGINIFLTSSV